MRKPMTFQNVEKLCETGGTNRARTILKDRLKSRAPISKVERRQLLDHLLYVEKCANRPESALQVLKNRRALGYRNTEQRMDAVLEACSLLYGLKHFLEARTELIELLLEKESWKWQGILSALSLYVDVDKRCREEIDPVLVKASGAVIKRLGIPISVGSKAAMIHKTIQSAHGMFRADSRAYSQLLIRAFSAKTPVQFQATLNALREFRKNAKAAFFRGQATQLIKQLRGKNRSHIKRQQQAGGPVIRR